MGRGENNCRIYGESNLKYMEEVKDVWGKWV